MDLISTSGTVLDYPKLQSHIEEVASALAAESDAERREELLLLHEAYKTLRARLTGRRLSVGGHDSRRRASSSAMGLRTEMSGCQSVTITVSQLFRMSDLIIDPAGVRPADLVEMINVTAKLRRAFDRRHRIALEGFGDLVPVVGGRKEFHRFWTAIIPPLKFASESDPPLTLVPFEMSPLPRIQGMKVDVDAWLREVIDDTVEAARLGATVSKVHAALRVYSVGVGVIRLTLALDFLAAVDIELLAAVARKVEGLLFVDSDGESRPFASVFSEAVAAVSESLFIDPGQDDRRWRPPETLFRFHQGTFDPEAHVDELAYLMSLSPGNIASPSAMRRRLTSKLRAPHWLQHGVAAVPSNRVVLLLKRGGGSVMDGRLRRHLLEDLIETHELVNVGLHARRLFTSDFRDIRDQGGPDTDWYPGTERFIQLDRLAEVTRRVLQAIALMKSRLRETGEGVLMRFAKDLWAMDWNGATALEKEIKHIARWIESTGFVADPKFTALLGRLGQIEAIRAPFPAGPPPSAVDAPLVEEQEQLENEILDALDRLDELLAVDGLSFDALDEQIKRVEVARRLLHGF
jgi:hypothetical protein